MKPVKFTDVKFTNGFWEDRTRINRESTLHAVYHQTEKTFRFEAIKGEWTADETRYRPHVFWDSDIAKWMEAAAYILATHPTDDLTSQLNEIISRYEKLQADDGYLNSYYQQVEPQKRWSNLRDLHELYCAGHMIEAAVAHYDTTGDRKFLDVMCRYADLIDSLFGDDEDKLHGYPGHQELELALVRLYEATNEERYLNLAKYFIYERGKQPHYYDEEAIKRGDKPENFWAKTYAYNQSHLPVREQTTAEGHSVRAVYMYAGMADIARITNDDDLKQACLTLWDDVVNHKLYITGALGSTRLNEGFTSPYDLPEETAYAETCASIALVFWAQRMFLLDPDSRYIDVMERALYNGFLSGLSLDGTKFFYSNPLASHPAIDPYNMWSPVLNTSGKIYERRDWYDCACCPGNIARLIASIGGYFYAQDNDAIYVNLYGANETQLTINDRPVTLKQRTQYPYDGNIQFSILADEPIQVTFAFRIPSWCQFETITVNGEAVEFTIDNGYMHISHLWTSDDVIELDLAMPIQRIHANPKARNMAGKIALQRGPLVYCLEAIDNGDELTAISVPRDSELELMSDDGILTGIPIIQGQAIRQQAITHDLYSAQALDQDAVTITAIPFAFWANRGGGEMRVWIRET